MLFDDKKVTIFLSKLDTACGDKTEFYKTLLTKSLLKTSECSKHSHFVSPKWKENSKKIKYSKHSLTSYKMHQEIYDTWCEMCVPAWHNHVFHFCFVNTVKEPQRNDTPSLEVYFSIIKNISWGIILKIWNMVIKQIS